MDPHLVWNVLPYEEYLSFNADKNQISDSWLAPRCQDDPPSLESDHLTALPTDGVGLKEFNLNSFLISTD